MLRKLFSPLLSLLLCTGGFAAPDEQQARQAAERFGRALNEADVSLLQPILPGRGKIQLRLERLGPVEGFFSPRQVEALLDEFLRRGEVGAFEILRLQHEPNGYALVHGRARVTDGAGRRARVALHLSFQPENGDWVLREIRESPS